MSLAPLLALAALGIGAIASSRSSSSTTPSRPRATSSASRAVCTYTAEEMPLRDDVRVRLWTRCGGRTIAEVEALIARGVAEGKPEGWAADVRRAFTQAQALAARPPDPLSTSTRREVEGHLTLSETAARGRTLGQVPETLSRKAEGTGAAAAAAGQRARSTQGARPAQGGASASYAAAAAYDASKRQGEAAQARARSRFVETQSPARVSGTDTEGSQTDPTGSQMDPSNAPQPDPVLARSLASQTARAVRLTLPGWRSNVAMFRTAAGLSTGTAYDAAARAALKRYGIRNAPQEIDT